VSYNFPQNFPLYKNCSLRTEFFGTAYSRGLVNNQLCLCLCDYEPPILLQHMELYKGVLIDLMID